MQSTRILAVLLVATFLLPHPSFAAITTTAGYNYLGYARAEPDLNQHFRGDHTTVQVGYDPLQETTDGQSFFKTAVGTNGQADAQGTAMASGNVGVLKAKVDATLTATNQMPEINTNIALVHLVGIAAKAAWLDSIVTYSNKVPVGTRLFVDARMTLDGSLLAFASGDGCCARAQAEMRLRDHIGNLIVQYDAQQTIPPQPNDGTDELFEELVVPFFVFNGSRQDIGYTLEVTGRGYANRGHQLATPIGVSQAILTSDFSETLTWGGIRSVVIAATGEALDDWTIESESGFDYSRPYSPIPEPGAISLLATGLAALACRVPLRRILVPPRARIRRAN